MAWLLLRLFVGTAVAAITNTPAVAGTQDCLAYHMMARTNALALAGHTVSTVLPLAAVDGGYAEPFSFCVLPLSIVRPAVMCLQATSYAPAADGRA